MGMCDPSESTNEMLNVFHDARPCLPTLMFVTDA
jgi:hypothetical protein